MSNFSFSPIYLTLYSYTFVLKSGSIFRSSIFRLESPSPMFSFATVVSSACAVVAVSSFFPSLVISIVYVFLVPFSAVTITSTLFVPFSNFFFPVPVTVAFDIYLTAILYNPKLMLFLRQLTLYSTLVKLCNP